MHEGAMPRRVAVLVGGLLLGALIGAVLVIRVVSASVTTTAN
jgi:hypothetical protein